LLSVFVSQKAVPFIAKSSRDDLTLLGELIAAGKIEPVIDSRYSLSDTADAVRRVEEGHARGKVIIDVAPAPALSIGSGSQTVESAVTQLR